MKLQLVDKNKAPTSEDFRPAAVQKALLNYSTNHWSLRYSIPSVLGAGVFGIFFGFSYNLFLLITSLVGLASASFVYNMFVRSDSIKKQYISELLELQKETARKKLEVLKENLAVYQLKHAQRQLDQFQQKFDTIIEIIGTKFDPSQLTYSRYYSIAQEVYLSGIDNLTDILTARKTMESIDLSYISDRLLELENRDPENKVVKKERDALIRSQYSHKVQEEKINSLVAENELALTQIDEATIAIAEISKSKNKEAQIDMDNSMKALAEMAKRSKVYSH